MKEKIYKTLIKLMNKAIKHNEVPVAALIVYNDKIIAKAYNKRENTNDVLGHAEILCIKKASKKLHTWKLDECDMYVTLKPCSMCNNIIKEARINNVYYMLDKPDSKKEYDKTNFIKINNSKEKEIETILGTFFKNKR